MTHRARVLGLALALAGCPDRGRDAPPTDAQAHAHERGAISATHFTADTELFVEFPPLVRGEPSPFAVHLTWLDGFAPVDAGTVSVVLQGGDAPAERFGAGPSATPGIFRPVAEPTSAGDREITVVLEADGRRWEHALGRFTVAASRAEIEPASEDDADAGAIAFLKEQQWRVRFSTAAVVSASLRESVSAFARLAPRADGEVVVSAPATGRLVATDEPLPIVGARVEGGDLLARFVPRLEGTADVASLDLAVTAARLDLQQATRERERLEGLLADGAVPQRRVVEAEHEEATARAALDAATRRTGQYRRVQRTGSRGAVGGIEIRTPLSGTVLEVHAVAGALVEDGAPLLHVVDESALWLSVQVPEVDAARLDEVTGVWFQSPVQDRSIEIGPDAIVTRRSRVDPMTRTVAVVFEVPNATAELRVGGSVDAHLLLGSPKEVLAVPARAVLVEAGLSYVYVQQGGESFERRQVRTGVRDGDLLEVEGVAEGERVVVDGAYAVKLASTSATPPAHGHAH